MFKRPFAVSLCLILYGSFANCFPDLIPEAITVYRNPEFFKNLNQDVRTKNNQKPLQFYPGTVSTGTTKHYKYPGETKKPNAPPVSSPGFEINYDNSPEFHHEPRDIFINTAYKPNRKKGPYSPIYDTDKSLEGSFSWNVKKPTPETQDEERNVSENFSEKDNTSENQEEEPKDFSSFLNSSPDEEFKTYHEPVLLAGTDFATNSKSRASGNSFNQPYSYNKTNPVLYDDWKLNTYPKIHAQEHLKSDSSSVYSEEPATNEFDANESSSHDNYDDEPDDVINYFDDSELKDLGADTKHIYKKLLNPKKFLFKLHSKPKLKKLKLKVKKSHFHNTDWFDEYPFNF